LPVLAAGKVGQEKGDGTRAAFFLPAASGVGTIRSRTSGLGPHRKPNTS